VAIDERGGRLLWTGRSTVNAVPLAGGEVTTVFDCCHDLDYKSDLAEGPEAPGNLAIDDVNGRIYVDGGVGGRYIATAPLDASAPSEGLYGLGADNYFGGLAVDPVGGFIYWTSSNEGPWPQGLRIQRAPLDGSGPIELLYHGEGVPLGIAVDAAEGNIYWTEQSWMSGTVQHGEDSIRRAPLDGSGPVETVAATPGPSDIALLRAPLNTGAPVLSGGATVGSELHCGEGTWGGDVHGSFVHRGVAAFGYRWQRNGSDVDRADGATFTPSRPGDYSCVVTATNGAGSVDAPSATRAVSAAPEPPAPGPDPGPVQAPGPAQSLEIGRAFVGRSGSIFVPITSANPTDATLRITFRKPTHGFRTVTRALRLSAGTTRARVTFSRKQRRKLVRIRRLRITASLSTPQGDHLTRTGTLVGTLRLP
jgi:hypothetical protein